MKKTTIQVSEDARSVLAIIKYQLDCKDYSETIFKIKEIITAIENDKPENKFNQSFDSEILEPTQLGVKD